MDTFLDWFWLMLWWFCLIAYLIMLFQIVGDLFRDHELNGWLKALWIIALIVLPFLAALIYVIARGKGMAERHMADVRYTKQMTDDYIRATAGTGNGHTAASEISEAKALYDAGVLDADEFARLKAKALA
jgi:hypothetical protein